MKAGFAERDITPMPGITLTGFGYEGRPSSAIRDTLSAKALVLTRPDDEALALVSTDLLAMTGDQIDEIERRLGEHCVPLVNHSHTHSGPAICEFGVEAPPDPAYVENVVAQIVEAVCEARDSAEPAQLQVGIAQARAGVNRQPLLLPNPAGPYDDSVTVLRVTRDNGEPLACWFSLAAHPTILQGPEISSDWPGVVSRVVSASLGIPALFAQGCAGDVMPIEQDIDFIARAAVEGVLAAWNTATDIGGETWHFAAAHRTLPIARALQAGERQPELRVSSARVGDLTIVAVNAEAFVRVGEMTKRLSPTFHTVVLGYTNGCLGYIPDEEAFIPPPGQRGYALDAAPTFFRTPPLREDCFSATESAVTEALRALASG